MHFNKRFGKRWEVEFSRNYTGEIILLPMINVGTIPGVPLGKDDDYEFPQSDYVEFGWITHKLTIFRDRI